MTCLWLSCIADRTVSSFIQSGYGFTERGMTPDELRSAAVRHPVLPSRQSALVCTEFHERKPARVVVRAVVDDR